jgi:hypothetical protein
MGTPVGLSYPFVRRRWLQPSSVVQKFFDFLSSISRMRKANLTLQRPSALSAALAPTGKLRPPPVKMMHCTRVEQTCCQIAAARSGRKRQHAKIRLSNAVTPGNLALSRVSPGGYPGNVGQDQQCHRRWRDGGAGHWSRLIDEEIQVCSGKS